MSLPPPSAGVAPSNAAQQPVSLQRQVFISHTGADEGGRIFAASILKPALERAGLKVFVDFEHLKPGCFWPAELVKAATTSAVFVAVLTETYPERYWCLRELDLAMHGHPDYPCQGEPHIIPVFYDSSSRVCYDSSGHKRPDPDAVQQLVQQQLDRLAAVQRMTAEQQQLQKELREHADAQRWANNLDVTKLKQAIMRRHDTPPAAERPMDLEGRQQKQQQPQPQQPPQLQQPQPPPEQQQQQQQQQQQRKRARSPGVPPPKDEEWQMARQVVAEAVLHIAPKLSSTSLVGFKQQHAELLPLLTVPESDVIGLWLHGAGGSGKTTMAQLLYDTLRPDFEHAAAVTLDLCASDSNSAQQKQYLEQQLLEQLAPDYNRNMPSLSVPQQLANVLTDKRVLLLVDNVSAAQQLTGLLPAVTGEGSCIIITSRQASMPLGAGNPVSMVRRQIGLLDNGEAPWTYSRQLFRQWSCVQEPTEDILEIENKLLQACGGLPLALQIIGGQVREEHGVDVWKYVHDTFSGGQWSPNDDTEAKLQDIVWRSFNTLTEAAQNIFLDCVSVVRYDGDTYWEHQYDEIMAMSHIAMSFSDAKKVWDAWWGPGPARLALKKLQELAFISSTEDSFGHPKLVLLDVLRLLGQSILHGTLQPGNPYVGSRIWMGDAGVGNDVLGLNEGVGPSPQQPTVISGFVPLAQFDLSSLRVLRCSIFNTQSKGALGWGKLLTNNSKLLFLEELHMPEAEPSPWDSRSPSPQDWLYASAAIPHFNPLIVRLQDHHTLPIATDILASLAAAPRPRIVELCTPFGESVWVQVHIRRGRGETWRLDAKGTDTVPEAVRLSSCLYKFTALQVLELSCNAGLDMLPDGFAPPALRSLSLYGFKDLQQLPEQLANLTSLEVMRVNNCASLASLPDWIGRLPRLQELDVSKCRKLAKLPDSLAKLTTLVELRWDGCGLLVSEETLCLLRTLSTAPMNVDVAPSVVASSPRLQPGATLLPRRPKWSLDSHCTIL